mgnify:FL=1
MTQPLTDVANADVVMICGGNPSENHPGVARFINRAREKGGIVISVDPRYTKTSVLSDIYAPIRPGTDIVFFNGMVNYVLQNKKYFEEYVRHYTNASYLLKPEFDFKDGYFSGWDATKKAYDYASWSYQNGPDGRALRDLTLQDPNCVFQRMLKFYSRYTPDVVEKVSGMKKDLFLKICETYSTTGSPDKSGCLLYAMGLTQHSVGTQNIRGFAILQLLLGNLGVPGGGTNAMRGEANVQGSTDMGLLYHSLPGYLPAPGAKAHPTLKSFQDKIYVKDSWNENAPKFMVSMLKAFWGDKATKENDFCYDWLPKFSKPHSFMDMFDDMMDGKLKGLMIWGMNPVVSGPNYEKTVQGLAKLEWLLCVDLFESETARFWKRPGVDPKTINTEVFMLPAASMVEKDGSATNTSRLLQMRSKSVDPIGDCKEDGAMLNMLVKELKKLYAEDPKAVFPDPITNLTWNYGDGKHYDADTVFKEINGWDVNTKAQLPGFAALKDDGSTTSGCWIYCGMYPQAGNLAKRRKLEKSGINLNLEWGWTWPMNRHILYNRASCDLSGKPWSEKKALIKWDGEKKAWSGIDVPDFIGGRAPDADLGTAPFIMIGGGHARLFAPGGMTAEGPWPEHYEPLESPVKNMISNVQNNPLAVSFKTSLDKLAAHGAAEFPYIMTTYRVAEHYQSGNITRKLETPVEAMPELFVEIDPELAKQKGIALGDWVEVSSVRGKVKAKAFVTPRIQPFMVDGKKYHVLGMPWNWGFTGIDPMSETKDIHIANQITPAAGDPNSRIPEYKSFMANIRKV